MSFFKNFRLATLAIVASIGFSLGVATPAYATETTPTECTGGEICGVPVDTRIIAIDLGAVTYGEGLVQAIANGDTMETEAWVNKTSGIDLSGTVAGDSCDADCASGSTLGTAWEKIMTGGSAYATGTGEASAGVANASVGAVSLLSRIRTGTAEPAGD